MTKNKLVAFAMAMALVAAPLAACSSSSSDSSTTTGGSSASSSTSETAENSEEVNEFFVGTWRGSVETTGESIYGSTSGSENMVDVILEEDGTCTVTPCENHEDLLTDEGTWSADGTDTGATLTLHLTDGDIEITVTGGMNMECDPTDFGIDGFDVLEFTFY